MLAMLVAAAIAAQPRSITLPIAGPRRPVALRAKRLRPIADAASVRRTVRAADSCASWATCRRRTWSTPCCASIDGCTGAGGRSRYDVERSTAAAAALKAPQA